MLKVIGVTFLACVTVSASAVVGTAAYVATGGMGMCKVETPDVSLTVPLPMRLAELGLTVARLAIPASELREIRREAAPFRPLVEGVLSAIADIPAGTTLVSVETDQETVLIGRQGRNLTIDVEAPDTIVHVTVPVRSIRRLGRAVGRFLDAPI